MQSTVSASPSFTIHEWGLIAVPRAEEATLAAAALSGAPRPFFPSAPLDLNFGDLIRGGPALEAVGLKPVIYVHVEGSGAVELSVRVGAPNGKMLEVLPPSAAGPETEARWNGLRASARSCRSTVPSGPPACGAEDRYCEALEDPFYDTTDASCLHLPAGGTRNHLFYRARVDGARLPFALSGRDDGTLLLRNVGPNVIAGPAFRIYEAARGDVRIGRFDPPAPGSEIAVPRPTAGDVPAARAAIVAAIRDRQLTADEAAAFDRAWASVLFGEPIAPEVAQLVLGEPPAALRASRDVVLYMLSDELAAALLPLGVSPRPAAVRRALFVRMDAAGATLPFVPTPEREMREAHPTDEYEVEQRPTRADGALSREQMRRVIGRHGAEVNFCAHTFLGPASSAEITVRIAIAPDGHVTATDLVSQVGANPDTSTCLTTAAERWTFPAADAPSSATQTFRFVRKSRRP